MSNSANSDEIDEVMSSVRKLVTKGEGQVSRNDDDSSKATSERLILTPALRVDDVDTDKSDSAAETDNVLTLDPGNRTEVAGLEATIAELEAAVTSQPDDWEPDDGEGFDEAAWAVSAMAAAGEAQKSDETSDSADEPAEAAVDKSKAEDATTSDADPEFSGGLSDFLDPSTTIDEDILRDMIVQIVREELSGDTGERITRNVRKLVRREINQILATRDIR